MRGGVAAATLREEADQIEIQADQLAAAAKAKMTAGTPPNTVQLALLDRKTGVPPVREDSASRLSADETTGWKPVGQDRRDAYPPAKLAVLGTSDEAKQLGADAARLRKEAGKRDDEALQQVIAFHRHLCKLRILDPACGTANFLYARTPTPSPPVSGASPRSASIKSTASSPPSRRWVSSPDAICGG